MTMLDRVLFLQAAAYLCLAGCALETADSPHAAQANLDEPTVELYRAVFRDDTPAVNLGTSTDRFCALNGVGGNFDGVGSVVHVRLDTTTNSWWLEGAAHNDDGVMAEAACISGVEHGGGGTWSPDTGPRDLGGADGRACFLTGIDGRFEGNGEEVRVRIRSGRWVLDGTSRYRGNRARARCVLHDSALVTNDVFWQNTTLDPYPDGTDTEVPGETYTTGEPDVRWPNACFLTGVRGRFRGPWLGDAVVASWRNDACYEVDPDTTQCNWALLGIATSGTIRASTRCVLN